jgi:hypothetical protein
MKRTTTISTAEAHSAYEAAVIAQQNAIAASKAAKAEMYDTHARWVALNADTLAAKVAAQEAYKAHKAAAKAAERATDALLDATDLLVAAIAPAK